MNVAHERARADAIALAGDAPSALLGARERSKEFRVGGFSLDRFDWPTPRPETTEGRARNDFLAAANDAPGAVVGSVGCCCPSDPARTLLDTQAGCGKHGDDLRRYLHLEGLRRERMTARLLRPRGVGRS